MDSSVALSNQRINSIDWNRSTFTQQQQQQQLPSQAHHNQNQSQVPVNSNATDPQATIIDLMEFIANAVEWRRRVGEGLVTLSVGLATRFPSIARLLDTIKVLAEWPNLPQHDKLLDDMWISLIREANTILMSESRKIFPLAQVWWSIKQQFFEIIFAF
jgi:hypothetical protein